MLLTMCFFVAHLCDMCVCPRPPCNFCKFLGKAGSISIGTPSLLVRFIMGYDIEQFTSLDPALICELCHGALEDPLLANCGHTCCKTCWHEYCKRFFTPRDPFHGRPTFCPVCGEVLGLGIGGARAGIKTEAAFLARAKRTKSFIPNLLVKQLINQQLVRCQNDGCKEVFSLEDSESHLQNDCRFNFTTDICGAVLRKSETRDHDCHQWSNVYKLVLANHSPYMPCQICRQRFMIESALRSHYKKTHKLGNVIIKYPP